MKTTFLPWLVFCLSFNAFSSNFVKILPDDQLERMRLEAFASLCQRLQICDAFANRLPALEGYKIVLICDDSGSMQAVANSKSRRSYPCGYKPTRWDELQVTTQAIIEVASVLSNNGVDILFLNRQGLLNVTNKQQIEAFFRQKPEGGTPIVPVLKQVFANKVDGKRLVILATDGEPRDPYGNVEINAFKQVLMSDRGENDFVTIVACTDDHQVMSYLNGWDHELPRLDVMDDYESEKREILSVQGYQFPFSTGDYVVKCMLGSIDPWFDTLDERLGSKAAMVHHDACHCRLF